MSDICYKKNYLKQVIARVDFAQPLSDLTDETLLPTFNHIKLRFPIAEQKKGIAQGIVINEQDVSHSKTEFPDWNFHGLDRDKTLVLNQHFMQVLITNYQSEETFRQDLIEPISSFISLRPSTVISRTGVRFINIYDFDQLNSFESVCEYFSDSIASPISNIQDLQKCTRSFLVNEFMEGDIKWRVQTGFFNPDFPAIIKKHHFAIDIDAYIDFPHSINDVSEYFGKFHKIIQKTFESLITTKLREEILNA